MHLSQKQGNISSFSFAFLKSTLNFEPFSKKKRPSKLMYIGNHGLRETCLNKSLKNPVSEDTLASGMVNGKKHC